MLTIFSSDSCEPLMNFFRLSKQQRCLFPLRHAISPHLNIYECCLAATFHYRSDCLARGSQSFPPAHVHFTAVWILACPAATRVVGVMEKNRRTKKKKKTAWAAGSPVRKKMNGVFKVTKTKLNQLMLWSGNRLTLCCLSERNTS